MSNFTKEELNTLHEFLDSACKNYHEPDYVYELRDKIKYVIDNHRDGEQHPCPNCKFAKSLSLGQIYCTEHAPEFIVRIDFPL